MFHRAARGCCASGLLLFVQAERYLVATQPVDGEHRDLLAEHKAIADAVKDYDLEQHHLHLLRLAAEALDRAEEGRVLVAREGMIVPTTAGGSKTHPAIGIERDSRIAFARLLREFDLDADPPADRSHPLASVWL